MKVTLDKAESGRIKLKSSTKGDGDKILILRKDVTARSNGYKVDKFKFIKKIGKK